MSRRVGACFGRLVLGLVCLVASSVQAGEPVVSVTTQVDFGKPTGQNPGSLFEIRNAAGRVLAGAGFPAVYNTRFMMDRQTLEFFVRPDNDKPDFQFERLPKPDEHAGLYMVDHDGRLIATGDVVSGRFHEWNAVESKWQPAGEPLANLTRSLDAVVRVGSGLLKFREGNVFYNDRQILKVPQTGAYNHFYYGQGRLFFYHTSTDEPAPFSRIHACRWTPESTGLIDVETGADTIEVTPAGVTTWAYGQLGQQVLTVTNHGGVHVHDGQGWRTLRERVPGVSYQVYSVLNYKGKLLLGHYPTGEIIEFDGEKLTPMKSCPPRLDSVSEAARECQTLAIYRGELFAGVWPWGEVWRHEPDTGRWHSMGRMFTHPEPVKSTTHPYEAESIERGLVLNHWGQRVTSLIPMKDALYISTSAKGNHRFNFAESNFLSDAQRNEYGAVLKLTMPGNLSAPIRWTDGPTVLTCQVFEDRLVIVQDNREIASTTLPAGMVEAVKTGTITWGHGLFGPLNGKLVSTQTIGLK